MKEPTFEVGETVIATGSYMHQITEGKEYTVTRVTPEEVTPTFTWPEYITVVGNFGTPVTGHAHRFKSKE